MSLDTLFGFKVKKLGYLSNIKELENYLFRNRNILNLMEGDEVEYQLDSGYYSATVIIELRDHPSHDCAKYKVFTVTNIQQISNYVLYGNNILK